MTDRDLYYCGNFHCDGHARSNECCCVDDTHEMSKPAPTYTVSGNHMRVWRLDPEGNPVGEAIEFPGPVSFDLPAEDVTDVRYFDPEQMTLELDIKEVDPAILALLTGVGTPPEEMILMPVTRKMRFKWWLAKVKVWLRNEEYRNLRWLRWLP